MMLSAFVALTYGYYYEQTYVSVFGDVLGALMDRFMDELAHDGLWVC